MHFGLQAMREMELRTKASLSTALNSTLVAYLILLLILAATLVLAPGR